MQGYRLFFWCRLFFYSLILATVSVQASGVGDVRVSYPSDFGKTLVGSAQIAHNSIQWTGTDVIDNILILGNVVNFGLTGNAMYLFADIKFGDNVDNKWLMGGPQAVSISKPQPNGSSMGYFFAPFQDGLQTENTQYSLSFSDKPTANKDVSVQGIGVADSESKPVLTLKAKIDGGVEGEDCLDMQQCKYINVSPGGEVIFTITPLSQDAGIKYAYVVLRAEEFNNNCSSADTSFKKGNVTQVNFDINDYYHILDGYGPNATQYNCAASETPVLRSIGKSYQIRATNIRETKVGGYAQYRFYLNGHWDINDTNNTKWPGSNIVYRLRTSTATTPVPSNPVAQFTAKAAGLGLNINLDASGSTPSTGATIQDSGYQWFIYDSTETTLITTATGAKTIVTVPQKGTYKVKLTVTDSNQKSDDSPIQTVSFKTIEAQANNTLTADFTATSPTTGQVVLVVTLDATANTGVSSYEWTVVDAQTNTPQDSNSGVNISATNPATPSITFSKAGTYKITLKTSNGSKSASSASTSSPLTVTVLEASTTTTNNPVASFVVTPDSKDPLTVTLDASSSRSSVTGSKIVTYSWAITNRADSKKEMILPQTTPTLTRKFNAGTYLIELVVIDDTVVTGNNPTPRGLASDVVVLPWLKANFTATPNAYRIDLDASASTGDNISYLWSTIGSNSAILYNETAKNAYLMVTNTLESVGVTLLVYDTHNPVGDSSSQWVKGNTPQAPIISEFTATPVTSSTGEGLTITLAAKASDPDGGKIVTYTWGWDCNNGSGKQSIDTDTPTYTLKCIGNKGGTYNFTLSVIDDESVLSKDTATASRTLNLPTVKFCSPTPFPFNSVLVYGTNDKLDITACPDNASQVSSYKWQVSDFTDTSKVVKNYSPTAESATFTFSPIYTPGNYLVAVKAADQYGLFNFAGTPKVAVVPPAIPNAKAYILSNPSGALTEQKDVLQPATFYAGVFDNNTLVSSSATNTQLLASSKVQLLASITPASAASPVLGDVDSPAHLLVVLCKSGKCYYKNTDGTFVFWDVSTIAGLGYATKEINPLGYVSHILVWNGTMTDLVKGLPSTENATGEYLLFVGYSLRSGNIVFNHIPFTFTVK